MLQSMTVLEFFAGWGSGCGRFVVGMDNDIISIVITVVVLNVASASFILNTSVVDAGLG